MNLDKPIFQYVPGSHGVVERFSRANEALIACPDHLSGCQATAVIGKNGVLLQHSYLEDMSPFLAPGVEPHPSAKNLRAALNEWSPSENDPCAVVLYSALPDRNEPLAPNMLERQINTLYNAGI